MKRTNNFFRALSLLLCLLTLTGLFAACKKISTLPLGTFAPPTADEAPATKAPSTTEAATDEAASEVRGTGAVSFCLTVTDLDGTKKEFVVKTDDADVGSALLKVGLIEAHDTTFGLYIDAVDGVKADFSVDGSWWAVYVDGKMSDFGISSIAVAEGLRVELKKTK